MKKILISLGIGLVMAGPVMADELADANALFAKKAYPQALQLYTKLANAGNAEAQVQLGQMYWYGEAGEVDDAKAETWFRKAAGKGNKTAVAALEVMKQRVVRRADIDYWVAKYDGADLKSGLFRCAAPRFPSVSKDNQEIDAVTARMKTWQQCYNGFVRNLNESAPLLKRIPADVSVLMNQQELDKASSYLDEVHSRIAEEATVGSKLVLADFGAWRSATDAYVAEHNAIVNAGPSAERQADIDARKRNYAPAK
jgi:TPR repeat protein